MLKTKNIILLMFSIFVCQLAGILGSIFTAPKIPTWYLTLNLPTFSPPAWVFAPIWITLYFLMGISLFIVLKTGIKTKISKIAIFIFSIQLSLNALWSFLFFGLQSPFYGLMGIIALLIAIISNIYYFYKVDKKAAYLLLPYLVWVSIATILNFFIFYLN